MKIKLKGFITSKESELYSDCADHYAHNKQIHKFAISDGVSKSFFPKIWSDILVNKYVNQKEWEEKEFIIASQKEWQSKIDEIVSKPDVKYYTRNAYNRKSPALATFVGLQFFEKEKKWIAQALGDSFLFFVPKDCTDFESGITKLSSKPEPIEFDNFPDYLSSIGNTHKGLPTKKIKDGLLNEGTFYLMTDALAEWFLQNAEQAIQKISNIESQEQFLTTIEDERSTNRLHDDDSALMVIEVTDDGKDEFTYSGRIENLSMLIERDKKQIEEEQSVKKKEIFSQEASQDSLSDSREEGKDIEGNTSGIINSEEKHKTEQSRYRKNQKSQHSVTKRYSRKLGKQKNKVKYGNKNGRKRHRSSQKTSKNINNEEVIKMTVKSETTLNEQKQSLVTDNPKTQSIFDKF